MRIINPNMEQGDTMTFDRQKLIETIEPVLKKYNVNTVYLFGSRVNGTHYPNS